MIVVDIETLGTSDLGLIGQVNYAKHKDTIISILAWKVLATGKTYSVTRPSLATTALDTETRNAFIDFLKYRGMLIAHNAPFELELFNHKLGEFLTAFDLGELTPPKYHLSDFIDTLTLSLIFQGSASLAGSGKFFKLPIEKDDIGKGIMQMICKGKEQRPRSLKTVAKKIPAVWTEINGIWYKAGFQIYEIMEKYCRRDVESTAVLFKALSHPEKMKDLGGFAADIKQGMEMTIAMNDRGVLTDTIWRERLGTMKDHLYAKRDKHSLKSFGFLPGQRAKLKEAINAQGYTLGGLGQDKIEKSFRDNEGHGKIKKDLQTYMDLNKTSLAKVNAAQRQVDSDTNILKGLFKFCGATTTGRFTSFGVQLQNLPRPESGFSIKECEKMIHNKSMNYEAEKIVSGIRGIFIPRKGYKFFIADLSQIELRWMLVRTGYLAKQQYLADGGDLYAELASSFFKRKIIKKDWERQKVGKPFLLALNYGLGVKTFKERYEIEVGEKITSEQAQKYIHINKQMYPKIPEFWAKYQQAINTALQRGHDFKVKLTSGRYLNYGKIVKRRFLKEESKKIPLGRRTYKDYDIQVAYFNGRKGWRSIYGSLVFQNVIQAECGHVLLVKMNALHAQGARIVMTIHDEVVVEVPEDKTLDECSAAWYNAGKGRVKELFPGLKVDSDCIFTDRYWSH